MGGAVAVGLDHGVGLVKPHATVCQVAERVRSGCELHGHRAGAIRPAVQRMRERAQPFQSPTTDTGPTSPGRTKVILERLALQHIDMVATSLELGADPRVKVARPERDAWLARRRPTQRRSTSHPRPATSVAAALLGRLVVKTTGTRRAASASRPMMLTTLGWSPPTSTTSGAS